jgi:hypothetical protein
MLFLLLYPLTYFILIKQILFSYTKIRLQKTLYSTRSCVNWAFFKLADSCQKKSQFTHKFVKFTTMYLTKVVLFKHR